MSNELMTITNGNMLMAAQWVIINNYAVITYFLWSVSAIIYYQGKFGRILRKNNV